MAGIALSLFRLLLLPCFVAWFAVGAMCFIARGQAPVRRALVRASRQCMEALGVTAIKIGQYLAIRRDLLPADMCAELSALYGRVTPMGQRRVEQVLTQELGRDWRRHYSSFDAIPIAVASIAQVHRARLFDGREVAVKVQRPEVMPTLLLDLRVLRGVAGCIDRLGLLGANSARALVAEIGDFTLAELDFMCEGRTADRLRSDMLPGTMVPEIIWAASSRRVLTMEFIDGHTLLAICEMAESGDRSALADVLQGIDLSNAVERLAAACFRQIFDTGRFHGDPHPANIMVRRDGMVVFIDFGIYAELEPRLREQFRAYVRHIAAGEIESAFRRLAWLVRPGPDTDVRAYRREAIDIMHAWYAASRRPGAAAAPPLFAAYQGRIFDMMRRHGITMPTNQLLFWRALAQVDATAQRLPAEFALLDALRRFFTSNPAHVANAARGALASGAAAGGALADDGVLGTLLGAMSGIEVTVSASESPALGARRDRTTRQLALVMGMTCVLVAAIAAMTRGTDATWLLSAAAAGLLLAGAMLA